MHFGIRNISSIALFSSMLLLYSCASYTSKVRGGLEAFERRDFNTAENILNEGAKEEGKDQLLYLFERGTVRHTKGDYEGSIKDFLAADKMSEIKDYTSLATEAATIITNDSILQYKGEEFENVMISVYLAIDFTLQGKIEDALIECRRVNRKLERLRKEGKRNYELNAFAQYLSGILYEKIGKWDDAYIDYKKTLEITFFPRLEEDLVRGALMVDHNTDMQKWKKRYSLSDQDLDGFKKELKNTGSIVFLYQNGFAPEKIPSPMWHEIPEYRSRFNRHRAAILYLDGKEVARTEMLYDVEQAAIDNLKQKYALMLSKRIAGVVGREIIGNKIDEKQPGLGTLVKVAMYMASQADLRSWLTLPKNLQMARVNVKPGSYHASIRLEGFGGELSADKDLGKVTVEREGDVQILNYRSLND